MSCTVFDIQIPGDKTGMLLKVVKEVGNNNSYKELLLASYFENIKFLEYLEAKTGKNNPNDVQYGQLRKVLNDYFNDGNKWVESTANRRQGDRYTFGFESIEAVRDAKNHTATLIMDEMFDTVSKGNEINSNRVIKEVSAKIFDDFLNIYANDLYNKLDKNHPFKKQYKDTIETFINTNKDIRDEISRKKKEFKSLKGKDEETLKRKAELREEVAKLTRRLSLGENGLFKLFHYLATEYGDSRTKNYANLAFRIKLDPNGWFDEVFTITDLVKYKRDFENTIDNEKIDVDFTEDDHDAFINTENSENLESRRWVDETNRHSNFTQLTDTDIKLYLSTIRVLENWQKQQLNGVSFYAYDTNNSLGVSTRMGADFILLQLSNFAQTTSVPEFIESIRRAAKTVDGLQGLIKVVEDMENNPVLANRLFSEVANPKINKCIIDIADSIHSNNVSNAIVDPTTYLYYNFQQSAKFTIKDNYNVYDIYLLDSIKNMISKSGINVENVNSPITKKYETSIIKLLVKYFPTIDTNAVLNYLHDDTDNTNRYIELIDNIKQFINDAGTVIEDENTLLKEFNKKYKNWLRYREDGVNKPRPVFNYDSIPYHKMDMALINIAQLLIPYTAVRNELNSFNAEGNLGADLIGNNYITNFIKDINYSTPDDKFAGLRRLGNFVYGVPQYENSPIFWGVKNSEGDVIIPGLFIKTLNGFEVNPDAKKLISINLFNGIRNQDTDTNVLYNNMSKADYFLSNIIAFLNPALSITQRGEENMGGIFLRTPSDAPKNFTINSKIAKIADLIHYDVNSRNKYILDRYNNLVSRLNITNKRMHDISAFRKNNSYTFEEAIDLINNLENSFDYTGFTALKIGDKRVVPIIVGEKADKFVIYLKGDVVKGVKNNIITNVEIEGTYVKNGEFSDNVKHALADAFTKEGINNDSIDTYLNSEHGLFLGFKQHLYTELHNLIFNLNNVFEKHVDADGNITYTTKYNITRLFDRYHFNGSVIVKDGKLTGQVFTLNKLFTANGYNVQEEIFNLLSLYGPANKGLIVRVNDNKLKLNLNHPLIVNVDGKIILNKDAVDKLLNPIIENWIKNFIKDIVAESQQYQTIINGKYSQEQINEAMLNAALMEMNFDDLFEGDSKFYKDTRDFFKRAKEIQASGKTYAGFNFNHEMGGEIHPILDKDGQAIFYQVGDRKIPITDGFKAATIKNTVRVSDNAEAIYNELLDVNRDLAPSTRDRIAHQISAGFGYKNPRAKTKTNDAQSYITIEEWIRRRYLDGTIDKYKDLLEVLLDPNADISKLPIDKVNKFIQVQKNFYFDKQFDNETETVYARQIKNAEFVLIPALIKGTSLEKLYNAMIKAGLGQINTVETDKASKRAILEFWNNDGKVSEEAETKFNEDLADSRNTEEYYYRYLYKQQDVAQHMVDAANKAGIQIMKKILDNADPAVQDNINKFFDNYVANIKSDFKTFIKAMGWRYSEDENGNIFISGYTNAGLDFTKFYRKAKDESARLGLDSNFLDYLTTDMFGNPIMPNFMNIASIKLESIAQAMFNSSITRQKLPGWHAAQITNVGYDSTLKYHNGYVKKDKPTSNTFISEEEYANLSEEEKATYQKAAYAEVRIPRWSKKIPKVKPGSEEEKALIANLEKEGLDLHIGYRIPTEGKQSISILKVVGFLDDIQGSTIVVPDEWVTQTGSDFDVDSVYGINFEITVERDGHLKKIKEIPGDSEASVKLRYINKLQADLDNLLAKDKNKVFIDLSTEQQTITKINDIRKLFATNAGIQYLCDKLDLMTFEEFSQLSYAEQQSKAARNNNILQAMIDILQHESSREENYSRSNFDNLTDGKNVIDELRRSFYGQANKVESTYNPLDQITFMENAMSGYSLKATSVNRDTFNSVCNFTRAKLNNDAVIPIVYDLNLTDKDGNKIYDKNVIIEAYGDDAHDNNDGTITVFHAMLGHSLNNRNVTGSLLTPYSAQTTAHILDAVKEGSIFNENMYTFGAFKTLLDVGTDYLTAIAFLQQPAITEIVNAYNETNSVYTEINGNPIYIAINRIANKLGITIDGKPINDNTSIYSVYAALAADKNFQHAIRRLTRGEFTEVGNIKGGFISLNAKKLIDRFNAADKNNSGIYTYDLAAEDIANILYFAKLRDTANKIEKIRQCVNPDRFGAKQSIFATRRIVNNIIKYLEDEVEIGYIVKVGNKSILEAIYPGINEPGMNIDVDNSAYRYLAAFMKYSTLQSIAINEQLFKLESRGINEFIYEIERLTGIEFNEEQARAFQQYVVTDVYNSLDIFKTPIYSNEYGFFEPLADDVYGVDNNSYWSNEVDRLNGYHRFGNPNYDFINADLSNPETRKEVLTRWFLLSPAQKVTYINTNFAEGHKGIFKYLNVNRWKGKDTIKYNDTIGDIETLYTEFSDAFFNKNPFIQMTALDLLKYAFLVEGFKFKKGAISKIVTNDCIIADVQNKGLNLLEQINNKFAEYQNMFDGSIKANLFIEKFIRSHSNYIKPIYVGKKYKNTFNEYIENSFVKDGIFFVPTNNSESSNTIFNKLGLIESLRNRNNRKEYIVLNRQIGKKRNIILYKLEYGVNGVYGYPLNKLEENENSMYSYNNDNNIYPPTSYFQAVIAGKDTNGYVTTQHIKDVDSSSDVNPNKLIELSESNDKFTKPMIDKFMSDVEATFSLPVEEQAPIPIIHNENVSLRAVIPARSVIYQYIPINGENQLVRINRYKPTKYFYNVLNGKGKDRANLNKAESLIIDNVINSTVKTNIGLYQVRLATQEEIEDYFKVPDDEIENDESYNAEDEMENRYSIAPLIDEEGLTIEHPFNSIDQTALDVANSIFDANSRLRTDNSAAFVSAMNRIGFDKTDTDSVHNNKRDIYAQAADYYENRASEILTDIATLTLTDKDGNEYHITDDEFYKHLEDNPDVYNHLVKLILECYNFGKQFQSIYVLDLKGEDAELTRHIERLKTTIRSITDNNTIKNAMANIFDKYLAETFSNNPNIRHGLINLRETFGDTDWWDSHFSDIGFINNNQVQVVVRYVNSKLNEISRFTIPKLLDEFQEEYDEIMRHAGSINMDHVVQDGNIVRDYSPEYITRRKELLEKVAKARDTYGIDSVEYWQAKLEKDEWFAKNVEQEFVKGYYDETNANTRYAFDNARDEFIAYQKLLSELRAIGNNYIELSYDQLLKRKEILTQLSYFTSKFNEDGSEKSIEQQERLKIIDQYKKTKREIFDKYYDTTVSDEIKNKINEFVESIEKYDEEHPDMLLEDKLADEKYKEAYDWLQYNTVYEIDADSNKKLLEAYEKFKNGENDRQIRIAGILKGKDVYKKDAHGNLVLDPRKISLDDMRKIKALYETEESKYYEEEGAEYSLIDVINRKRIIGTDRYYEKLKEILGDDNERNIGRDRTIKKINSYLIKGVDESGRFDIARFFENNTVEELEEVVELIEKLSDFDSMELSQSQKEELSKLRTKKVNKKTFNEHKRWAINNLSEEKLELFYSIFSYPITTKKGNTKYLPNGTFYNVSTPNKRYIDNEKTNAKNFINENVEYINTPEYEETAAYFRQFAEEQGEPNIFNDWFEANHIYNRYTHKYEPLGLWKKRVIKPGGSLNGHYEYNPTYENTLRNPKEDSINTKFDADSYDNYNRTTGEYNNLIHRTDAEIKMAELFQRVLDKQAGNKKLANMARKGFMPRRAKIEKNNVWYARQAAGALGLDWISYRDKNYSKNIDYTTDREGDFNMATLLRQKGSIDISRMTKDIGETDAEFEARVKEAKENNAAIDKAIMDKDWASVMKDYIEKATMYNAKEELKSTVLLLIEDLKTNEANEINHTNNVSISRKRSTSHNEVANTEKQLNTVDIVEMWYRRVFRNEFKKKHRYNEFASLMQNLTSAKYMVFNVTGGIANVWTGVWNIMGETLAENHFTHKEFAAANAQYMANVVSYFSEMYSEKSSNLTNALIKRFNVVNYEEFSERRPDESVSEYIKRFRNWMYGLQSSGEHYMQNTVLLAMLKSHRIYTDIDGKKVVGTYQNYIWEIERQTLKEIISKDEILKAQYDNFIKEIKNNKRELYKLETLREDLNVKFLRALEDESIVKEYIERKKENLAKTKEEFNKFTVLETKFKLENGRAVLIDNEITERILGDFTNKVIYVNKEIHGVYDKIGAAKIEREWWGGLVMQYHKHLYPGIMKRFRWNGYFNEQTQTFQKGSYISAINLMTIDFDKALKVAKDDSDGQKIITAVKSIQNISKQIVTNITHLNTNWALLPEWERNNVKKAIADQLNILACITMAIGIHIIWDEDEIKDSNTISTAVYLANRFYAEGAAYTPWGVVNEAKTLYSSPIAATNAPQDVIKFIGLVGQMLFDSEFDSTYSTGLYKGRNKLEVLVTRNIPAVRVYNRLNMMSKNNQYYRLNSNTMQFIPVKTIGDKLAGRD